jgi:Spy/CpxP family protein refolding chaperone
LLLLLAVLLAAAPTLSANAQRRPQLAERGFPAGLAEARLLKEKAQEIGVGEETLKKLEALVADMRAKEHAARERLGEAIKKVDALLDEGRPDEQALLEASAAASNVSRETRVLRLKGSLKVRALLTPEQLGKFMEIRKKAMSARRGRGQRPRG